MIMEEREINLISLLFHVLLHWRSLIVAGLIGMFLACGSNVVKVASEVAVSGDEGPVTIPDEDMVAVNVYANNIKMYESMQDAWAESEYMALDGNNVAKTGILLTVKGKKSDRMANIAKAYRELAVSTGAVDFICEAEGIQDAGIVELINVDTNANITNATSTSSIANTYIGDITTYVYSESESECVIPIYIEILGQDADASERRADLLVEYLNQVKSDVISDMGEHSLTILSRSTTVGLDSDVVNKQNAYYSTLSKLYDTIYSQKIKLSSVQLEYSKSVLNEVGEAETGDESVNDASSAVDSDSVAESGVRSFISFKFLLIGLFFGVFCMTAFWSTLYIFSNKLKVEDSIERLFNVSVVGIIPAEYEKKRIFGFVDKCIMSIRDRNKRVFSVDEAVSLVASRIKVQSTKDKVSKLVFVGCDLGKNVPVIPRTMAEKLSSEEIKASVLDNVLYDPENTEKLGEMDGAVIIEKAGKTLYSELAEEIELLKRQQIKILGCVIVE